MSICSWIAQNPTANDYSSTFHAIRRNWIWIACHVWFSSLKSLIIFLLVDLVVAVWFFYWWWKSQIGLSTGIGFVVSDYEKWKHGFDLFIKYWCKVWKIYIFFEFFTLIFMYFKFFKIIKISTPWTELHVYDPREHKFWKNNLKCLL